ncbi:MAG: hypothetical protein JXQ29_16965 [Planctomycetes bacterium]|nr:hypothetical protein [Planctomycetota bacterium]
MPPDDWRRRYADRCVDARDALARIRNGQTLFIGSGCGEPRLLTRTLAAMASRFADVRIIHILAQGDLDLARPELLSSFRYNTLYVGRAAETAVASGVADFTPIHLSEVPEAIARGLLGIDVALVQVSPPDPAGFASLGISVDIVKAAVENARLVIAQVNAEMPRTAGDSLVAAERIHLLVDGTEPLLEVAALPLDPVSLTIGRHVANLIADGTTLHFDTGVISAATMRCLDTKRDLGIHTDILTDDILRLIQAGVVTNRTKEVHRGKTVATIALGSRALYAALAARPDIELHPIDVVGDPGLIARHRQMLALQSVEEVDLTGVARLDSGEISDPRRLPGGTDFLRGVRRAAGGLTVVALPSTTADGAASRIAPECTGRGVYLERAAVDAVVTEFGSVFLQGLTIRERAVALLSVAHPRFRPRLLAEARRLHYLPPDQILPSEPGWVYPHHYEFHRTFAGGLEVFFRPVKPFDARRLQQLFYSLSPESIRLRYHGMIRTLPDREAQKIASVDYSRDMALIGLVGRRTNREIVVEGRYTLNTTTHMGEFDILVKESYRGLGLGMFVADTLKKIAYSRGLEGVYADVIEGNAATMALLSKAWPTAEKRWEAGSCVFTLHFPPADIQRPKDSIIVYSGRFNDHAYGENHPFRPDRARTALRLIHQQGFLGEPWMRVEEPAMISRERLIESHAPAFVAALERANGGGWDEGMLAFHLGGEEAPVFKGLFDYVLLYVSATLTGADRIIRDNANVVFNPLGGFHHSSRDHAEGFCYLNDVIAAIDTFLVHGHRVAYLDLDAHHGNGVQDAYYHDDRVLVLSLHETGRTLYPWSGFETEIGAGAGRGFTVNVPLPPHTDDEAYAAVFDRVVPPAVAAFRPSVVVAVVGGDTHRNDPLTHLSMTNNVAVEAMKRIRDFSNHLLLLGGGGYHVEATARQWCRVWATANRIDSMPDYLTVLGGAFLGAGELQGADLVDMAYRVSGAEKQAILEELDRIARFHEETTLPLIRGRVGAVA